MEMDEKDRMREYIYLACLTWRGAGAVTQSGPDTGECFPFKHVQTLGIKKLYGNSRHI